MKNNILLFFTFLILLWACKKPVQQIVAKAENPTLQIHNTEFFSFSTKAKIHYKDNVQNLNCIGNIRMQKDSIIWISATYMGLEVGRIKMTPDSIIILNRVKSEYSVYNFKQFGEQLNVEIDFASVQAIFLGNEPLKGKGNEKLVKGTDFHLLSKEIANFIIDYKVNAQNLHIEQLAINEKNTNNKTIITYSDFQEIDTRLLPTLTTIHTSYIDSTQTEPYESEITFNYLKSSFSDSTLNYPFHVPSKFIQK